MNGRDFFMGESSNKKPWQQSSKNQRNNTNNADDSWLNLTLSPPNPSFNPNFICPHCNKVYPTSQALGGHQNAHRRECRMIIEEFMLARKIREREVLLKRAIVDEHGLHHVNHNNHGGLVLCPNPLRVFPPPGWPEDSSSTTEYNPLGGRNARDGNEATSGVNDELDLTLKL